MEHFDVVIIGAGAAGLMCALTAGRRGRRVLVLDHADEAGRKILISGGGRCNFTNREATAERFVSGNPHFCKSALSRFTPRDFVVLVEKHRIPYHEKKLGQLFCDRSARDIVAMLLAECDAAHVDIRLGHRVTEVGRSDGFRIDTDRGAFAAPALVLASGGLAIPKMGASDFTHRAARRFGLKVTEVRPALVPLTARPEDHAFVQSLSGVSVDAVVSCGRRRFREHILFTHRGLSGPAILQISSYWRHGEAILLDLLPDQDAAAFLLQRKASRPKAELRTVLAEVLPQRLAQKLAETRLPDRPMNSLPDKLLRQAAELLKRFPFVPSGSEGYAKAEVTLGGVCTAGLSSQTMAARSVPGLHVIGEAVDVTGWLGGYNFQWAWSSGWCAGHSV